MIPLDHAHLYVSVGTNPGRKGKNNEDRFGVSAYQVSEDVLTPSLLAVIADGVGGHRAGEVAAEMAVEIVSHVVAESDAKDPGGTLADAIRQANLAITTRAQSSTDFLGMGTTCACVWILGDRLYTASVGDSRIYLLRNNEIKQITIDHTWIQEAIDAGVLMPEQARGHPNAHVIRRHLGSQQSVVPDFRLRLSSTESDTQSESNQGLLLHPDDQLLLCSDGLTDMVSDAEILTILSKDHGENAIDDLIALANEHGGHDNITVIVMRVPEKGLEHVIKGKPQRSLLTWGLAAAAVLLSVLIFIIGSYYWLQSRDDTTSLPTQSMVIEATSIRDDQQMFSPTDVVQPRMTSTVDTATTYTITPPTPTSEFTTPELTYTPWPTSTQVPTDIN
jgi:serine/threonine protein phosphatase PrpC